MDLKSAEALKDIIFPDVPASVYSVWEDRAQYLHIVRLLYAHDFEIVKKKSGEVDNDTGS